MINTNPEKINEILSRGVEEIFEKESLLKKLQSGKQLRIKFGIDPTSSDLHLGHSISLRKLRQFQDLGHKVVLLIGDFTATIGDPAGKSSARPVLTEKQVKQNMKDYIGQATKILDIKKTEIRYNTEWFEKMKMRDFYLLARMESFDQLSARSMFRERLENKELLTLSEFTYPLLQGYDSVKLKADVEMGGTDQIFNMLHGRKVQKRFEMPEQDVVTVHLLEGTDGVKKMSKSIGNYVSLNESPKDMYGKVMGIPDGLIFKYIELLTDINAEEVKKNQNPRDQKARLAKEIVTLYHGKVIAEKAAEEFNKVFRDKQMPSEIKIFKTDKNIYPVLDLLFDVKLVLSKNEAKRLIGGGAVEVQMGDKKERIVDWKKMIDIKNNMVIKVGRKFIKIEIK